MTAPQLPAEATVLMTDLVDSTALGELVGETAMQRLWLEHDRGARALIAAHGGVEIGRSDGFLACFPAPSAALAFAAGYHALLTRLTPPAAPALHARIGAHHGPVQLRVNEDADRARGAAAFELDSLALPIAARAMAAALAGQTLVTRAVHERAPAGTATARSHGHWRLKGVPEPIELFEVLHDGVLRGPPPDSAKAYRVLRDAAGLWQPVRELPLRLPTLPAALVGRAEEQAELAQLFDAGARLVTVLGIGGVGKTRLALHHAHAWRGEHPGGTWFCDLSAARSLDGVLHAVAQGLELPLSGSEPLARIGAALAGRGECLVVLDNFEQVARHAAATLGAWLALAPAARFLVTSREVLGLPGERVLVLAPLASHEAVALFRARALEAGVAAAAIDADPAALAELVELLDRLPLALELAASRARVMPPAQQRRHIGERFRLLARSGARHDRQATMRAALDWSWELLDAHERAALARLSVFEGGFTLEAAAAVIGADDDEHAPWAPDLVQALVEKSLVRRVGPERFDLLRTVQDYAAEHLDDAARGEAERRHLAWFAGLTEARALADRCVDTDNLVAACRRTIDRHADPARAAVLLQHAWAALSRHGPMRAAAELAQALLDADPDAAVRVVAHRVLAAALALLGRRDEACRHAEAGLALATQLGLAPRQAQLEVLLAEQDLARGALDAAAARLTRAQRAAAGDAATTIMVHDALGWLAFSSSRYADAAAHFEAGLALARASGEQRWQCGLLGNLGSVAITLGRPLEARPHLEASLALADALGDRLWAGNARCNLGLLLLELGDATAARDHLERAAQAAREGGERRLQATAACNLALTLESLGEPDAAAPRHAEAVAAAAALGDRRLHAQLLGYQALLMARRSEAAAATTAFAAALAGLQDAGDPAALGLLQAQRAEALLVMGDTAAATAAAADASSLLAPLALDARAEPMQALARANAAIAACVEGSRRA